MLGFCTVNGNDTISLALYKSMLCLGHETLHYIISSLLLFTMESKQSCCQCHVHGLLNYYMDVIMLCLDVILRALLLILHGDGLLRNLLGTMEMHMRVV